MSLKKKTKVLLSFCGVIIGITFIWYAFHGLFCAYCSDAYIRTNIAEISPRIEGHLLKVNVVNNQLVKKGQELLKIDPYPYLLERNIKKAGLEQQNTQLEIYKSKLKIAQDEELAVKGKYDLALSNLKRYQELIQKQATTQELLEKVEATMETNKTAWLAARENTRFYQQSVQSQNAIIESSKAELALAEYRLTQTSIKAECDGYICNINCRPGDFVQSGQNLFGLISTNPWWVEANYKEYLLKHIKPGSKVLIVTDLYQFKFMSGEVESISRGTLRESDIRGVLPTVSPTTDWVRLEQRFQVRIKFKNKLPDNMNMYMGSDVRTFVWLW